MPLFYLVPHVTRCLQVDLVLYLMEDLRRGVNSDVMYSGCYILLYITRGPPAGRQQPMGALLPDAATLVRQLCPLHGARAHRRIEGLHDLERVLLRVCVCFMGDCVWCLGCARNPVFPCKGSSFVAAHSQLLAEAVNEFIQLQQCGGDAASTYTFAEWLYCKTAVLSR